MISAGFTKPVDPLLGRAIEAWEAVRPAQPPMADRKTGEAVDLLFACRARPVANTYINGTVIPMLCRKAGVAPSDVRGRITSHRARATIASQLYNAKEPMTLFELQAWLGHRSPETTQHYAQITPNTLTKAYTDAGYSATATAAPRSSSSALTGWPAHAATSTLPSQAAGRSCSRRRRTWNGTKRALKRAPFAPEVRALYEQRGVEWIRRWCRAPATEGTQRH